MKKHFIDSLNNTCIITDGAMGTYYEKKCTMDQLVEWANLNDKQTVIDIHKEYLRAGASLIRTNTFAANSSVLRIGKEQRKQIITEGYRLAKQAIEEYREGVGRNEGQEDNDHKREIYVAADIGPIPIHGERTEEENIEEYKEICQSFIDEEANIFLFETFSNFCCLEEVIDYIRKQVSDACIITNFCINKNGYTMSGVNAQRLLDEISQIEGIQVCGFNCGIGSGHMVSVIEKLKLPKNKVIAVLPNAGYPEQLHNRMVFANNIRYFVDNIKKIREYGVDILGGCCGTTPAYISELVKESKTWETTRQSNSLEVMSMQSLSNSIPDKQKDNKEYPSKLPANDKQTVTIQLLNNKQTVDKQAVNNNTQSLIDLQNSFSRNLAAGKKVIAVELDPPYDSDDTKLLDCVARVKEQNVDLITIADSPMGRSRVDSILMSIKIMQQYKIPVMPHVCCRDKNMIAMRSTILGGYLNGIRNMLVVTGDPVPCEQRLSTTNVFDYNSIRLMNFVKQMNIEHFSEDPLQFGGALNPGLARLDKIIERMQKKIDAGATFFLTQPIYSDEVIERICYIKKHVKTKILCGIMPFVSFRNANFIKNEFTGICVPDEYVCRYSPDMSKEEAEQVGVEIGKELMKKLEPYADGYYFMLPFNRVSMLEKILN